MMRQQDAEQTQCEPMLDAEYVRRAKIAGLRAMAGRIHMDDTRQEQREADRRRQSFLDELRSRQI